MPACTTIITSIEASCVDSCRQFIRQHVEPACTASGPQCSQQFRFDLIPTLHFCSFCILDKQDEFDAYLVFEATFDGSRQDFLSDLLRLAPEGMHELYRHCVGYPVSGLAIPEIAIEYLVRHDVGAHTFFCGSPGRTVAQVNDEHGLRAAIVEHLSTAAGPIPPRLNGLFEEVRGFIRGKANYRWAEQPSPIPWEVRFRRAIKAASWSSILILACGFGAALAAGIGRGPVSIHDSVTGFLAWANQLGAELTANLAMRLPPRATLAASLQPAIPVIGLSIIWLLLRFGELLLSGRTERPREQFFLPRLLLHIVVILRHGAVLFVAGAAALAFIQAMATPPGPHSFLALLTDLGLLIGIVLALPILQHFATTLRLSAQLKKLSAMRETLRRLWLDLVLFSWATCAAFGILIIARQLPLTLEPGAAEIGTLLVQVSLVIVAYGIIGAVAAYVIGCFLLSAIRVVEVQDRRKLGDPADLLARARVNAAKYAREEGGNNTFQNHLASLTRVKPGRFRICLVRAALFVIGLLSRFWFNRGELGGIPTILSARWVLIDRGRRLLFLDNYGGAWESYLNEFIDMGAVKGLNAIWSNTFVKVHGRSYGFPETRFFFWRGAQAERPFKAYVRESQIETLAWYSAYPTLSVVTINTNSRLRQSLSKSPSAPEIDTVFQHL